ncbi:MULTISPECIES: TIGR01777 family oxidoreductase [Kocuria]|uniref:TIGR01777 family protein n=2 Tax=Kocuria TaxID=57493 RepID=A0A846TXR7_9MICC|nr:MULTISPECIES: TIGR01777 family oxidoreductase [Kocuria]NKE10007.1 TIGR01777 family protein [Kocuria subflava]
MAVFESTERLEYPLDRVWAWHQRPGALTRLSPEWAQAVVSESFPPLQPGTRARLLTSVPGTAGTVRVPFVSEHDDGPVPRSFVDRMVKGPLASWTHTHTFADPDTSTGSGRDASEACVVHDRIQYQAVPQKLRGLSSAGDTFAGAFTHRAMHSTLAKTFADRTERLRADLAFQTQLEQRFGQQELNILIGGASGLVGSQVAALLSTAGHQVRTLVRGRRRREDQVQWDPAKGILDPSAVVWADVVIHLGGKSIATRFTESNKQEILNSRIESTRLIVESCAALDAADRPQAFICASAIGAYGTDRGDALLSEKDDFGDGFLAEVCQQWESEAARVQELGMRWVSIRTGIVLSSLGGVLKLQLPLYLVGAGGPLGSGQQWFSWVSLDDIASMYAWAAVDESVTGPVNAVAPEPVRQKEFAKVLGKALRRPAVLPVPSFGPAVLLGRDGAKELALANQRVTPEALETVGFPFRHQRLSEALEWTLPPR